MSHFMKTLSPEEQESIFSNYLIDSWSYSKVQAFTRNQKVFEMESVFGLRGKRSPSSIAGNGYHQALAYFFGQLKDGIMVDLPAMEVAAFEEIGSIAPNQWKLGKTTPTMEKAVEKSLEDAGKLLRNFYGEKAVYLDDLAEILGVEQYFNEFLTVNGVDIRLPAHGLIDLAIRTKDDKIVIIDHKSKGSYTDDDEAAMVIGQQAITYTLGFEALTGMRVDEVWFVENKASQNKDKTAQVKPIVTVMDANARKLYELLLYEGLREMLNAVSNPDHVYTINTSDKFVDMAEVFDFWTRTQICEVEDFNVDENKKELVAKRLRKIRNSDGNMINPEIIKKFREKAATFIQYDLSVTNMTPSEKIIHSLKQFGIAINIEHFFKGYSSDTYLLEVGAGTMISAITKRHMEIANALDVPSVRIGKDLKVYNGRSYVSVEIEKRREKTLLYDLKDLVGFKIPMGRDNYDNVIYWDLDNQSTPHMLVGGTTGSGKSVFILATIAYAIEAGIEQIIILDPKNEFSHLSGPGVDVIVDILEIEEALAGCVTEMNGRVMRKINRKTLVVFDEYADAISRARKGEKLKVYKQVTDGNYANGNPKWKRAHVGDIDSLSDNLAMLLQKGRSSGFRIICAAQRPSTDVIPGDAKANFPVRVAFRLPKALDSNVVLGEPGAEILTDKGDGLVISPEYRETIRFQSYFKPEEVHA